MFAIILLVIITFANRTHVTGAITHGYGTNVFLDVHTWPHDANLVLNILMELLKMREFLPEVLYLQLDNTARENKNKFCLAFLALLVEEGIFSEVCLAFTRAIIIVFYNVFVVFVSRCN